MSTKLRIWTGTVWRGRGLADFVTSGYQVKVGTGPSASTVHAIPGLSTDRYVSPSGSNSNDGLTTSTPWLTFEYAMANTPSGGTVILRAGTYREGKVFSSTSTITTSGYLAITRSTPVTIQPYGSVGLGVNETAVLDGSVVLSSASFAADGSWWSVAWTARRRDPGDNWSTGTYPPVSDTWNTLEPDSRVGWQHVDYVNFPCAARPERVWIDGVELTQVALLSQMAAGKFFIDAYTNKLYLPISPVGHTVEISSLQTLVNFLATDCKIQGFTVRRYATSKPQIAPIKFHRLRGTVHNMVFEDNSAQDISGVGNADNVNTCGNLTVTFSRFTRTGVMPVGANMCDYPTITDNLFEYSDFKRFNYAPTAACVKLVSVRFATIARNEFSHSFSKGVWFDVDCQSLWVYNNDFHDNWQRDIIFEMSRDVWWVGNRHLNTGWEPVTSQDTEGPHYYWCNSITNPGTRRGMDTNSSSARALQFYTDERTPRESSRALAAQNTRDARIEQTHVIPAWPTATNGYQIQSVDCQNNIIGPATTTSIQAYIGVDIQALQTENMRPYTSDGITLDHNWYNRTAAIQYPWLFANPVNTSSNNYTIKTNLAGAQSIGFDLNSVETVGTQTMDTATGNLLPAYRVAADAAAAPIPAAIATLLGVPAGTVRMGPIERTP